MTDFASLGVPLDARPLSPFPLPFLSPLTQLGDLGEHCKLPQLVQAEPGSGHQTHFGAFTGKNEAFKGQISRIFNRQNSKVPL